MPNEQRPVETLHLGALRVCLRPAGANVVAAIILAMLFVGGGLAGIGVLGWQVFAAGGDLPVKAEKGMSWTVVGLGGFMSLLGLTFGAAFFFYFQMLRGLKLNMHEQGLHLAMCDGFAAVRWDEIELVEETIFKKYFPIKKPAKRLIPMGESHKYSIWGGEKEQAIDIDGNIVKDIDRFGKILKKVAKKYRLAWQVKEEEVVSQD